MRCLGILKKHLSGIEAGCRLIYEKRPPRFIHLYVNNRQIENQVLDMEISISGFEISRKVRRFLVNQASFKIRRD